MRSLLFLSPLALAACATADPPAIELPAAGTCNPAHLAQFVGRSATADLAAEMVRVSRAREVRWVPHNGVITMDLRQDRLTVWLTADNRVERASCT